MSATIIFDIDDTICTTKNREYKKAIPKKDVIKKINHLHDDMGFCIKLHTSRGMVSCEGNLNKVINKNKDVLEKWLKENDVHYDELIFGKPIADIYVDDRGMSLDTFMNESFEELKGGSKDKIIRLGNIVKKTMNSVDKVCSVKMWFDKANSLGCKVPKIISSLYDSLFMEYVEKDDIKEIRYDEHILKLICVINNFKYIKVNKPFDINVHLRVLVTNLGYDSEIDKRIARCFYRLHELKEQLKDKSTFCHGDMTLSNVIFKDGEPFFIDPNMDESASSYILDYAKLRMSLMGYEEKFNLPTKICIKHGTLEKFDKYLKSEGIYEHVMLFNYMYVLRLTKYKKKEEYGIVLNMAKSMEDDNGELLQRR